MQKAQEILMQRKKSGQQSANYTLITIIFQKQSWSSMLFGGGQLIAECPKMKMMAHNKVGLFQLTKMVRKSFKIPETETFHFFKDGKMMNSSSTIADLRKEGEDV